jgi:hypothetical protein
MSKVSLQAVLAGDLCSSPKMIVLRTPAHPESPVVVAKGTKHSFIVPMFEVLREFLHGNGDDDTVVEVLLQSDQRVTVCPEPTREQPLDWTTRYMSAASEVDVTFTRSVLSMCTHPSLWALPMGILVVLAAVFMPEYSHSNMVALVMLAGLFWMVSALYLTGWLSRWTVTLDRTQDAVVTRPAYSFLGREKVICRLSEVAALQTCREPLGTPFPSKSGRAIYELNLIVKSERNERVNVCRHRDLNTIMEYAQGIADSVGLPVLDHTGPICRTGENQA